MRGDTLYAQALPSGRPRLVAVGRGLAQPRLSPTGAWLAFHLGPELRVMRLDGSGGQKLAAEAGDFAWAPADDRLAYVADGNLVLARPGGMGVVLAARTKEGSVEGLAWSPDGARLAFALRPGAGSAVPRLWTIPARGGPVAALPLPNMSWSAVSVIGWAGPERVLAVAADSGGATLYALHVGGGAAVVVVGDSLEEVGEATSQPGGAAVAIVLQLDSPIPRPHVLVWNGVGAAVRVSGQLPAAADPDWSPDGRRLAWCELVRDGGLVARRVMVADVPGGGAWSPHPLGGPPGSQEHPRWTNDGRHVLFVNRVDSGEPTVWLLAPGESPRQVVRMNRLGGDAAVGRSAWSEVLDYAPAPPSRGSRR